MIKCSGCAGCDLRCGKEELPNEHDMICFIVNSQLETMTLEDLANYYFDREYSYYKNHFEHSIVTSYLKAKEKQDERDRYAAGQEETSGE